jgi:hypothetical protein
MSRSRDHVFPISSNDPQSRQQLRDFSNWNTQLVKLSKRLISCLSDHVGTWDEFTSQRKDIDYFLDDRDSQSGAFSSSSLQLSITAINNTFSDLKTLRQKLVNFEKELRDDNPQGVSLIFRTLKSHVATIQSLGLKYFETD